MCNEICERRMSQCQSFGSHCNPCSQSRKISIGIAVDSSTTKNPTATKDAGLEGSNAERVDPNKKESAEVEKKFDYAASAVEQKQNGNQDQVNSPWMTTRPFSQKTPTSEPGLCTKPTPCKPVTRGRPRMIPGVNVGQETYSVQFFANKTSVLQSAACNSKSCGGITYKRKVAKDGNMEGAKDFTFATAQNVPVSDEEVTADKMEKTDSRSTETLRMKLWQILGTVSSPKSQHPNSQAYESQDKFKPKQVVDQTGETVIRPKQNSDTIELDSESPDQRTSRPMTRLATRNRASSKMQLRKTTGGPSSTTKPKSKKKNIFTFEEGAFRRVDGPTNCGSLTTMRKKNQRKSSNVEPRKICFSDKKNADEPRDASCSLELPGPVDKACAPGNQMGEFHSFQPENREDCFELRKNIQEKDPQQLLVPETMNRRCDSESPTLEKTREQLQDCRKPSWKDVIDPPDNFQSPTFVFKTPISVPSPCSTPQTPQVEQDVESPDLEKRRFPVGNIRGFSNLPTSELNCSRSDSETESPDVTGKLRNSSPLVLSPEDRVNKHHGLVDASSEDGHCESSEEGSPVIRGYDCDRGTSPRIGNIMKPNCTPYPTKSFNEHGGFRVDNYSSPLPSPKGNTESDFEEALEQNQEDDLTRAVTLFASALDNFRRKMELSTKKKSSNILISVSEGIHLQLQNAESQIQTDVGKLTSQSKSKRKCMESRFQEQQEQLDLIYKKFKEDIYHHLNNCRSTLEVMEVHQNELKGTAKKQRTSHQKLLVQLEETVRNQLDDAQRKITMVQESAKEKMIKLKQLIAECFKEVLN